MTKQDKDNTAADEAKSLLGLLDEDEAEEGQDRAAQLNNLALLGEENPRTPAKPKAKKVISIIMSTVDKVMLDELRIRLYEDSDKETIYTNSSTLTEAVENTSLSISDQLAPAEVEGGNTAYPITKVTKEMLNGPDAIRIKMTYAPNERVQEAISEAVEMFQDNGFNPSESQILKTMLKKFHNKLFA